MKFTGFTSGCIGKVLLILLCLVLGAVLAIGGEVAAGYILLTREGFVGTVADKVNNGRDEPLLDLDDDVKAMSLMAWGQEIITVLSDFTGSEIGDIEKVIGMPLISEVISDALGVDANVVKKASISNLGETISNNLTINLAKDKFGIQFPSDIPLFSKEEFLKAPLSEAFKDITEYKLCDFIAMDNETNSVLRELKDLAIKDLGGAACDEKIKSLFLCEIMDIDEDSSRILQTLKYCSIESQYVNPADHSQGYKKKLVKNSDGTEVMKDLIGLNEEIELLTIGDVVDIDENSHVILRKMNDSGLKITELGGPAVTDIVNDTKLGEIIPPTDSSANILKALSDTKIGELDAKMNTLAIEDIFDEDDLNSGALSLIPADTVINGIPGAMTEVMKTATTATMLSKGLISGKDVKTLDKSTFSEDRKAFILNNNVGGMMGGLIEFANEPITLQPGNLTEPYVINYHFISPDQRTISANVFNSLSEFVGADSAVDGYMQYETVKFTASAITIHYSTADERFYKDGYYYIPVFNGIFDNGTPGDFCGITFDGFPHEVRLAVYEYADDGFTLTGLARNQCAYSYFKNVYNAADLTDPDPIKGICDTVGRIYAETGSIHAPVSEP